MSSRATVIGLLTLAALAAFVWFYEIEGAPDREQAEAAEKQVFPSLEAETVTRVLLRTTDEVTAELVAVDGRFRLVAPVDARADGTAAAAIPDALVALESEAVYDEPESLEAYGLDLEPTVRFETASGERALRIGATAPVGGGTYLTDAAAERVWLVPAYQVSAFSKSLAQLREARVVELDPSAVRTLTVAWDGARVELQRADGDADWLLQHPIEAPARRATVSDLLSDLEYLRADGFVDEPTPEQVAGFESPGLRVTMGLEGGESVEFSVGAESSEGVWLARGAEGAVFEIGAAAWQDLPQTVQAFRFRELANFSPSAVERFTLDFSDGAETLRVEASRTAERDWEFADEALTGGAPSRLLSELSRLEADEILAESMGTPELAGIGLTPARVRIRAFDASDASLVDVSIGNARGDGALAAMREGSPIVYWLSADVTSEIPVSLEAFREGFRLDPEPVAEPGAEEALDADDGAAPTP